jgi:CO/xanthine dehydrogenase Mo-binding subunit
MVSMVSVGQPIGHVEGPDKVTGRTTYAADVVLPGMLWGKCLRSPFPHARITSIDTSAARALPGVHAVITGRDIPETRIGRFALDMPVLARDRVRFIGEKVAAVAADSPDIAEQALLLIEVEYEELPAVFDAVEALEPGAPNLHPESSTYQHPQPQSEHGTTVTIFAEPNVVSKVVHTHGNLEQGFAQAERIFEHTFYIPSVHHGYMEPHASTVQIQADGKIEVWHSNKSPYVARRHFAAAVGVEESQVRFNTVAIGGDFGGKGSLMDAVVCYYLAQASGRPVKIVMTYTEELMAGNPRHATTATIRTGVNKNGEIVARQARVILNSGAYSAFTPNYSVHGAIHAVGSYRIPNAEVEAIVVYTNTVPTGHMRAPGGPQAVFAVESHTDMIANELGIDPLEFRLRNCPEEGDAMALGEHFHDLHGKETLLAAAQAAGWDAPRAANVGRGLAMYDRPPGIFAVSNATLSIDGEGRLTLLTGAPDTGTGSYTILQQVVAEEFHVPLANVTVVQGDTDTAEFEQGAGGSRLTSTAGQATLAAVRELKLALAEHAAHILKVAPNDVRFEQGSFVADGGSAGLADVALHLGRHGETSLTRSGTYTQGPLRLPAEVTSFCAQIAEVEVDPETGQVKLRKITGAYDVGTVINPLTHQGQIDGGAVQGLGQALIEHLTVEDGAVTTLNLGDYKLPTMADIPELTTVLVESKSGPAPYQGKAIGELSIVPTLAAIANAVFDAVGVRFQDLPITAEKVYTALQASQTDFSDSTDSKEGVPSER